MQYSRDAYFPTNRRGERSVRKSLGGGLKARNAKHVDNVFGL